MATSSSTSTIAPLASINMSLLCPLTTISASKKVWPFSVSFEKPLTVAPALCSATVFSTAGGRSERLIFFSSATADVAARTATALMLLALRMFIGQLLCETIDLQLQENRVYAGRHKCQLNWNQAFPLHRTPRSMLSS